MIRRGRREKVLIDRNKIGKGFVFVGIRKEKRGKERKTLISKIDGDGWVRCKMKTNENMETIYRIQSPGKGYQSSRSNEIEKIRNCRNKQIANGCFQNPIDVIWRGGKENQVVYRLKQIITAATRFQATLF